MPARATLLETQRARAAIRARRTTTARLVEVGVVGRRPEHRRHRNPRRFLEHVGERARRERLVERHQRSAEQAGLLPRRHDDSLPARAARKPLRGASTGRERRRELIEPARGDTGAHTVRVRPATRPPRGVTRYQSAAWPARAARESVDPPRDSVTTIGSVTPVPVADVSLVIRLPATDRAGPIELLRQHESRELVRQRPGRERTTTASRGARRSRPRPNAPPMTNRDVARPLALLLQPAREFLRRHRVARSRRTQTTAPLGDIAREQPFPFPLANEVRGAAIVPALRAPRATSSGQ